MGFLLLAISSILKWLLTPVAYVWGFIHTVSTGGFSKFFAWDRDLALAKDRYGNVLCQHLFNQILIIKGGYEFGRGKETISSVIGKNKVKGTLTGAGRFLDRTLSAFQPNHSINSIDNNVD